MKQVSGVQFKPGTSEESLPEYDPAFPCISTRYRMEAGRGAPWHWHSAAELFYIEEGTLEYFTPSGQQVLGKGWGGFLCPNVPHATLAAGDGMQTLHLFDPRLISGGGGGRLEEKFVLPVTSSGAELLVFSPDNGRHALLLDLLRRSFALSAEDPAYELKLHNLLSELWLQLFALTEPAAPGRDGSTSARVRQMLIHVHEHYGEELTAAAIAGAAHVSERTCYALFRSALHTTPMGYVRAYRLRKACELLALDEGSMTEIGQLCGLGSGSRFARVFREEMGVTPLKYRKQLQKERKQPL